MAPAQALQTSKRKFYKLLDNLSTPHANLASASTPNLAAANTSTTTLSTTPSGPPSKRSRLSDVSAADSPVAAATSPPRSDRPTTAPARPRAATLASALLGRGKGNASSVRLVGTGGESRPSTGRSQAAQDNKERSAPNYTPYSQPAFLARLKTFTDVKLWTPKPEGVESVEWAKRGWVCLGEAEGVKWTKGEKDVVGCRGGCEKRVVVKMAREKNVDVIADEEDEAVVDKDTGAGEDWRYDEDLEKELVERYKGLIADGHDEECLWRKAGCKDDIYRIRFGDASHWQHDIVERYSSLLAISATLSEKVELPHLENGRVQFDIEKSSRQLEQLLQGGLQTSTSQGDTTTDSEAPAAVNRTALALALFGWTGQSQHRMSLVQCTHCFQRIGLWLYSSNPDGKIIPAAKSGIPDNDIMSFDPIDLHRQQCPWRNQQSQAAMGSSEGLAGWEILARLVLGVRRRVSYLEEETENLAVEQVARVEKTEAEIDMEDKARESRMKRLKKALSVKKRKSVA